MATGASRLSYLKNREYTHLYIVVFIPCSIRCWPRNIRATVGPPQQTQAVQLPLRRHLVCREVATRNKLQQLLDAARDQQQLWPTPVIALRIAVGDIAPFYGGSLAGVFARGCNMSGGERARRPTYFRLYVRGLIVPLVLVGLEA
jgi:hypothetical protein